MKVSLDWLREWVDTGWNTAELSHRLTMAGFEVEARHAVAGEFTGVVVGEVLETARHPDADKLTVCRVAAGGAEPLQIVCGAKNVRPGLKAPLATVGAQLPGGLAIRKAKLRGVESQGMLCSSRELELGEGVDGLLELPSTLDTGQDLRAALGLDDVVLEINFTPNRGDALSVLGLARELAVLSGRSLRWPTLAPVAPTLADTFPVRLDAPAAGPKFAGRVLRGLDPRAETPLWMRERLRRAGLRSLGPLVDVTNYVMLELGQPMHAYDLRRLQGGIEVRFAGDGERLVLLDGREVALEPDVLVIADAAGPVGMAGIMGGEKSGIATDTTDVFLEVAWFAPDAIAGRARRHKLLTDASQRFERGVDPAGQERAIERATQLLLEIAGGQAGPAVVTAQADSLPASRTVELDARYLERLLGIAVPGERVESILRDLGMQVSAAAGGWRVVVPSWRFDVAIPADLVEEVARVYGYAEIPPRDLVAPQAPAAVPEGRLPVARLATRLVDRGSHEAITYSFVEPGLQRRLFPDAAALPLANPISADLAEMRVSLWPGLVHALQGNVRRQQERVRIFEFGSKFIVQQSGLEEIPCVAGLVWGHADPEQWGVAERPVDFHDAKADVEALLAAAAPAADWRFEREAPSCLHPGRSARIYRSDVACGWLGELHPEVARALDLGPAPYLFELELGPAGVATLPVARPLSTFPAVRRDLAVVVKESVTFSELQRSVTVEASAWLRDLVVFDVYRGPGIETGTKSVALGLILQDNSKTLTDSEVDALVAAVVGRLKHDLSAQIRE
ncbi:MAG: phenylalanine--tRNA ligase subunit beta [Pseudomonadota bacterium]